MRPTLDVSGNLLLLLLFLPLSVLLVVLLQRVRARLRTADPVCLERLRRQGVLCGDMAAECRQLAQLLAGVMPAVWLRERTSVVLYGRGVRLLHGCLPSRMLLQRELGLVAAYQAHRYADALLLMQQLRDDGLWRRQLADSWQVASKIQQ